MLSALALSLAVMLVVLVAWVPPACAQEAEAAFTGIELTTSVHLTLRQISEASSQWQNAVLKDDRPRAEAQLEDLHRLAAELRLPRLPDVSLAAAARAVEVAEAGDFTRAAWALEAAEELDPGRSETSFARADIARLQGRYLGALVSAFEGYRRLVNLPWERSLWLQNLLLWVLYSLLVAGGLFVGLQIVTKGEALIKDLIDTLTGPVPLPVAVLGIGILLVGPLFLPYGLLWFLLLWSLLLWGYGSHSERWVLVGVWLLLGLAPLAISIQQDRVAVLQSAPVRALNSLSEGRLYGQMMTDLGALRAELPGEVAVEHLVADLHWHLGQWPQARWSYRQILDQEPRNVGAMVNLGVYYFLQRDYGRASRYFEDATLARPDSAATYFNLSQAYLSSYLYDDSREALAEAQALDSDAVGRWLSEDQIERVQAVDGGLERIPEIRGRLLDKALGPGGVLAALQGRGSSGRPDTEVAEGVSLGLFHRGSTGFMVAGLILLAVALHLSRRTAGYSLPTNSLSLDRSGGGLLLKVLVPGLASAQDGRGVWAYLALLLPVALLLLPLATGWGFPVPWGYAPGSLLAGFVATVALVVLMISRLLIARAGD